MVEDKVTGLVTVYRTPHLIRSAIESIKSFYPNLEIVIVNNSPIEDECTKVIHDLSEAYSKIMIIQNERNLGHGYGLNEGMKYVWTPYVYIFDSDIKMIRGGMLEEMLSLMSDNVYGIGYVLYTNRGGAGIHRPDAGCVLQPGEIIYLHPFSCVISVRQYRNFPKFHSRGAPFSDTMSAIFDTGYAEEMILQFPVKKYIKHLSGGTRGRFGIPGVVL